MFDRIGLMSIGLVFGIILMLLFNNLFGLVFGVVIGVSLIAANQIERNKQTTWH
ncbi:MAG: hypothetical protein IKF69_06480 [Exiguobacterium sp.]|uniref:hypothetical protein n=1 Tax=Exiguobacterium sp. s154 TaxID=2751277 RepID=UPI001BEB64D3|nr:hypothetical protein [Exiguobacterium sp. s154]MBR3216073.1 hypothetical protein [Exiguobacterium sp.]